MPFLGKSGAGGTNAPRQTPQQSALSQLEAQAGRIVGFALQKPPNATESNWAVTLQAIVESGNQAFGRGLLANLYQTKSGQSGVYGNLTGKSDPFSSGGVTVNIGGGDSGPSAAERRRALRGQLAQSGFGVLPFDVSGFIKETVKAKGNFDSLVTRITGDPRFQNAFPGILDKNGNLRTDPRSYKEKLNTYSEAAAQAGVSLSTQQFGALMNGEVSEGEFNVRLQAASLMKANRAVFKQFNRELKSRGLKALEKPKDVLNFLTGKAPKAFYSAYEEASVKAAATAAGVKMSDKRAANIARRTEGISEFGEVSQAFASAIESIRFAGDELRSFGLSEAEVQNIALGIAPEAKRLEAEKALRQREAALQTDQVQRGLELSEQNRPILRGPQQEAGA